MPVDFKEVVDGAVYWLAQGRARPRGAAVTEQPVLLTQDAIVRRLSDAHARRLGPSILLSSILVDQGWRVSGGAAWPTLEEAVTGRAAVGPITPPPTTAAEYDDGPIPF